MIINHLGEIRKNNQGTPMEIVGYRKKSDIDVKFLDKFGYIKEHTLYINFKSGSIRNPYDITVCGRGYLGVGYPTWENNKPTISYQTWQAMLRRCYDPNFTDIQPSYNGKCEVCEEWYNFQTFAEWFYDNFYQVGTERMHVDKDILYKGNKIYCPEKCIIVPQRINMLFMHKPNKYGLPNGVKPSCNGKYEVSYNGKHIGTFSTIEEAAIIHDKAKKVAITEIANKYKNDIPTQLYDALINWKPDYTDGFIWVN